MDLLFSYAGRIGRGKFWLGLLLLLVPSIAINVLITLGINVDNKGGFTVTNVVPLVIAGLIFIAMLYMEFAIFAKRSHDRGRSGWFSLLMAVPFLNFWAIVELGFLRGVPENNEWGPPAVPATA